MHGLTQEDSSLIGFVVACYFCDAIDSEELNRWAEHMIATREGYPDYMLDLLYFDEARFHIFRVIGFTPSEETSEKEDQAICGIAYLRGRPQADGPAIDVAFNALIESPAIKERFLPTFPFLEVPLER
ncbi:hypothetical protein LJR066_006658 [Acidovorax sp. LjRoot66]|uniref:hypothetical protein n=1 Tax=Acidovorax sp. LjRoot66 TaxID=3342334 RepID=UPI003ECFDD63